MWLQSATPLNCTVNAGVDDNGEFNHCEWGLVSRDGWVVYDDSFNAFTDENDWWSTAGPSSPNHNTKGYSSTYLAMGFAHVRAGTWYPPEH